MATNNSLARPNRRKNSLRIQFVALAAAVLVPGLLLGGWFVLTSARAQVGQLEVRAADEVRAIAGMFDRELTNATNILTALSTSHFLQSGDLRSFHDQASEVARRLNIRVVLRDANTRRQLLNTGTPWGRHSADSLTSGRARLEEDLAKTGQTSISNVYYVESLKQFIAAVAMPVRRDGAHVYTLAIGIPVSNYARALELRPLPAGWIASVIDLDDKVVARSSAHGHFVGKTEASDVGYAEATDAGNGRAPNRQGSGAFQSSYKSEVAGWRVIITIPDNILEMPVRDALTRYVATGAALSIAVLGLSFFAGGRVAQSMGTLGIERQPTRDELRLLFNSSLNGILVIDENRIIVLASPRLENMFRYEPGKLIGEPVDKILSGRFEFAVGRALPDSQGEGPGVGRRQDGGEFPIEMGYSLVKIDGRNFIRAAVMDISARKLAEERLASAIAEREQMRRRLMQAQEDERLRLARDLHDQTGQSLAAAMLDLKAIEPLIVEGGRGRLRAIQMQFHNIGQALHRVAWELRPAAIDELGLASALASYVEEWSSKFGIEADFHCRDTKLDGAPVEIRTTLYRLVQEGLTNIVKHAPQASSVSIIIDRSDDTLRLTIEDDGPGFDPLAQRTGTRDGGLGIAGMRERLALLGGTLEIESTIGRGTTIYARIPIEAERLIA
ncbi:MAG TPA: ATP-binding protein [Xanthobacteraceae bacterium]|jgi:PAS domain S-box-containing protein|nr:ATP-binding protein [Xanthobacteraceae bacterium]